MHNWTTSHEIVVSRIKVLDGQSRGLRGKGRKKGERKEGEPANNHQPQKRNPH